jgi:two-component system, cell cycle sensor histidine kinase and response regulator CckA
MWRFPLTLRISVVALAFLAVTMLGIVDSAAGPGVVILGALSTGPCLAAGSARPWAVLAVGAYALVLINVLSGTNQIWGSVSHLVFNAVAIVLTAIGVVIARQLRVIERAGARAHTEWHILAAIVAHSDDAIVAVDLDCRVTAFNAGAERLYGRSAAEIVGMPASEFAELVVPADAPGPDAKEVMARVAEGEQGIRFKSQRIHRDGTVKDVSVTVSPVRDGRGEMVGISSASRDISAQKLAEERDHQSQRMVSLGQLAGGVAHDFNNLLGIMLNFTTFAEEASTDPDVRADLAKVLLAGGRAVDLTHQLLTFTRQEPVRPEILDVNVSINEVHAMLARTIGENIQLVFTPATHPLTIHADAGQVQQILLNLALNARDAMPEGGTMVIEASASDLDERQTDLNPAPVAGHYVRLLVSDTGSGMTPEVASRVFEPFFTTKPKGHGTGLGLATVYGIVTEAGGSINVYSEPGIGTTFRVYFPLAGAEAAPPADAPQAPPDGGGRTVLVVEDEVALGEAAVRILTSGGYRTLYAEGGAQALALESLHHCDLLLTDVIMPEMSGRQLAEKLVDRHPGLPVLYMSGYSDGLLGDIHLLDGGFAFIEKPFTAKALLHQVGAMFPAEVTPAGRRSG